MGSSERDDAGSDAERLHHARVVEMEAQLRRRQPQHFHQVHRISHQRHKVSLPIQRHTRGQARLGKTQLRSGGEEIRQLQGESLGVVTH